MLFLVNGSLTCSQRSPQMEAQSRGQLVMTPKVGRQDGKADRGGEPVNQEELGARARECDKKKQKRGKISAIASIGKI